MNIINITIDIFIEKQIVILLIILSMVLIIFSEIKCYRLLKSPEDMSSGAIKGEANGQLPISFRSLPIEIFISNFLPTETSFSLNPCIYVFLLYHFL